MSEKELEEGIQDLDFLTGLRILLKVHKAEIRVDGCSDDVVIVGEDSGEITRAPYITATWPDWANWQY